jgi:phosphate transport system permease protein
MSAQSVTSILKLTKKQKEVWVERLLFSSAFFTIIVTAGILIILLFETAHFFLEVSPWEFLTSTQWTPLFSEKHFGIMPLFCGTFLTSLIAMLVALPLGLVSSIYLSEYATEKFRNTVKPLLEVLAAVPTVVYGYFALLFVTPLLQKIIPNLSGFNALSAGIVMGIMIIPIISSISEDAMHAVPMGLREGAYALGSTRFQVSWRVVVPAAFSGIAAAFILGMSRAIGETMIVAVAAGSQPQLTLNPLDSVQTITAYIVQVSLGDTPAGTIEYATIFAAGMALFVTTLGLNLLSFWLRKKFRETYE